MTTPKKLKRPVYSSQPTVISDYLHDIYEPAKLAKIVNRLARKINALRKKTKIDAIAFTGQSGSSVAYPLSYKLGIPLICIRKGCESHSSKTYEGICPVENYVIVDDFIDSGDTIDRIVNKVKFYNHSAKLAKILLYQSSRYKQWGGTPVSGFVP
jgi:adenine/guanine phosphoribosyltransferase-like PRPP-binding protein